MSDLTKRVSELAKKEGIQEMTIASSEGLPITSNAKEVDKESAKGVDAVQQRLLKRSGMRYLTFVDGKGMKVLYHDDKFYYIVRSHKTVDNNLIAKFRRLLDAEMAEREEEREMREEEAKRIKEEREMREEEAKRIKEEREMREEEAKRIKEEREMREEEAKRIKEEREMREEEAKRIKEEREMREEEAKRIKEEREMREHEIMEAKEGREKKGHRIKKRKEEHGGGKIV